MIHITSTRMSSGHTPHTATAGKDGWLVTWLPGRPLTQNQAVTAMLIAETIGTGATGTFWSHLDGWAAELGLDSAAAIGAASQPPPGDNGTDTSEVRA